MEPSNIFYDNKEHIAQLQSDIFNEELEKKLKGKVRKASWTVFRGLMENLLGTDHIEENFTYKATLIAIPRADAIFHVLINTVAKMSATVKKATGMDLHPTVLKHHLENLEPYQKLMGWFSTGTAQTESANDVKAPAVPWERNNVPVNGSRLPTTGSGVPLNASAPGTMVNPLAGQPQVPQVSSVPGVTPSIPMTQTPVASYNGVPMMGGMGCGNVLVNPLMQPQMTMSSVPGYTQSGVPMNASGPIMR